MSYERWCVEEREQASLKYNGTRKGAFRNQNQCSSKRPHGAFLRARLFYKRSSSLGLAVHWFSTEDARLIISRLSTPSYQA